MSSRAEIAASAARKLASANVPAIKALIGLDGFVDEIIAVVDKRTSPTEYTRVPTIEAFAKKIAAAANQSANYEFVTEIEKLGGNGPIMANAMAAIGFGVTYVGCLGFPAVHPVFADMAKKAEVLSVANPGHTDALEFTDGKLMLGKHFTLADVNWQNLLARIGQDKLTARCDAASLIAMTNWTMLPYMTDILRHTLAEIAPKLSAKPGGGGGRTFFIDLADPEKRKVEDIRDMLALLTDYARSFNVILGLNHKEAVQIHHALGLHTGVEDEANLEKTAAAIRDQLRLNTVVIHPRKGAAGADATGTAWFAGPFVKEPKLSTGAGDNFNAGFAAARLLGLNLEESLCAGTATSGFYVRNAASPTIAQLADFVKNLPAPQ
jgi:hypothetical protein